MYDELTPVSRFGRMVADERARRRWSMRDLCAKAGLPMAPATIQRIEQGGGTNLDIAVKVATALGLSLDSLITRPACMQCGDSPPPGFTCNACGTPAPEEPSPEERS